MTGSVCTTLQYSHYFPAHPPLQNGCLIAPSTGRLTLPPPADYPPGSDGQPLTELCVGFHRNNYICQNKRCRRNHTPHDQWPEPLKKFICEHVSNTPNLTWNMTMVTPAWLGLPGANGGDDSPGKRKRPNP